MTDVYELVTNRIIANLESGKIPWKRPWKDHRVGPKNLISMKHYRGINRFLLAFEGDEYFLTFKQIKDLKGHLKKGSKGIPIVKVSWVDIEDKDDPTIKRTVPFAKYFIVFALRDTEGIERPAGEVLEPIDSIEECEKIVAKYNPEIRFGEDHAFYRPSEDFIGMPDMNWFKSSEGYYSTLFHEMVHMSGSSTRLKRFKPGSSTFGSETYSKEELVAEFGSAYLCALTGIDNRDTVENTTAYIASWIDALKKDKHLLISAAGKAQHAVHSILNYNSKEVLNEEDINGARGLRKEGTSQSVPQRVVKKGSREEAREGQSLLQAA